MASIEQPVPTAPILSKSWKVLRQHKSFYTGGKVQVSADEAFAACWNAEDVSLVSLRSGEVLRHIPSGGDAFTTFALHPSGHELVTVGRSTLLRVWDLQTGKVKRQFKSHAQPVLDVCYDPSGTLVATASADQTVRVWNVEKGFATHNFRGHTSIVLRVFFHPSVKRLEAISCGEDGEVRVWNLRNNASFPLKNHMSLVTSVTFSASGDLLYTGGRDRVINVWNVASRYAHVRTLPVYEQVESMTRLPTGYVQFAGVDAAYRRKNAKATHVLTAGDTGQVRIWNMDTYTCVSSLRVLQGGTDTDSDAVAAAVVAKPADDTTSVARTINYVFLLRKPITGDVSGLSISPSGDDSSDDDVANASSSSSSDDDHPEDDQTAQARGMHVLTVTGEQILLWFKLETFARQRCFVGFNDEILDVRCLPDNQRCVVATNSENARVFNINTFDAAILSGHSDIVLSVDVSPDGQFAVTGSKDSTVRLWSLTNLALQSDGASEASSHCVAVCRGHTEAVGCVAFSVSKALLPGKGFFVSGSRDRTVKLWEMAPVFSALKQGPLIKALALSTRSACVAHDQDMNCIAVSPNDKIVATGSQDKTIKLFSAADLSLLGTLKGHKRGVWSVQFSPVDKVLASAAGDKTIKLWSLTDMVCLKTFEGHTNSVLRVKFINHGMQLMSSGSDETLKLWTIKTNECINTFADQHSDKVWALDAMSDQQHVVSGGADSVLNVWQDVTVQEMVESAQQEQKATLADQDLQNCLVAKDYTKALLMSFRLDYPRRMLQIFQEVFVNQRSDESGAMVSISSLIKNLKDGHLSQLLRYIRDWNTNAQHSQVAHEILKAIFRRFPPAHLAKCLREAAQGLRKDPKQRGRNKRGPNLTVDDQKSVVQAEDIVTSLLAYSERHFTRVERLLQKSFLIDYTFQSVQAVAPSDLGQVTSLPSITAMGGAAVASTSSADQNGLSSSGGSDGAERRHVLSKAVTAALDELDIMGIASGVLMSSQGPSGTHHSSSVSTVAAVPASSRDVEPMLADDEQDAEDAETPPVHAMSLLDELLADADAVSAGQDDGNGQDDDDEKEDADTAGAAAAVDTASDDATAKATSTGLKSKTTSSKKRANSGDVQQSNEVSDSHNARKKVRTKPSQSAAATPASGSTNANGSAGSKRKQAQVASKSDDAKKTSAHSSLSSKKKARK